MNDKINIFKTYILKKETNKEPFYFNWLKILFEISSSLLPLFVVVFRQIVTNNDERFPCSSATKLNTVFKPHADGDYHFFT